jgi:hypothetical protein
MSGRPSLGAVGVVEKALVPRRVVADAPLAPRRVTEERVRAPPHVHRRHNLPLMCRVKHVQGCLDILLARVQGPDSEQYSPLQLNLSSTSARRQLTKAWQKSPLQLNSSHLRLPGLVVFLRSLKR